MCPFTRASNTTISRASSAADAAVCTASADNNIGTRASEPTELGADPTYVASATMIEARQSANTRIFMASATAPSPLRCARGAIDAPRATAIR